MNPSEISFTLPPVSFESLAWNLLISTILSSILCWHYIVRSKRKYLRRDLGLVLPVICLTTLLVISVVKSSLALSLGLVGALSIVRFRTPIKEPEELAYIFLAIAIGLALGADQREIAVYSFFIILFVISIIDRLRKTHSADNSNLLLTLEVDSNGSRTQEVLDLLESLVPGANIRRVDQDKEAFSVVALIKIEDKNKLVKFSTSFQETFPNGQFSLIEDSVYPNE